MNPQSLSLDEAMRLAGQYAKQGNATAAAELYQRVLAHSPQHKKARKALRALQKSAGPETSLQADLERLLQLYQGGHLDRAIAEAKRLSRVYPDQPLPLNIIGAIEAIRENHEKAVEYYQRALVIDPNFLGALNNLGVAFERLGRHDQAIDCFRKVIAGRPDDAEVHYNLGSALRYTGLLKESVESYLRSIDLRPMVANTHVHLGLALMEMNRSREAIITFQSALKFEPALVEAHEYIGDAYRELAQQETAISWYQKTISLDPGRAGAQFKLGKMLLEQGRREEAAEFLKRSLELEPDSAEIQYFVAAAENRTPDIAPRQYISTLFDGYAARFDEHLGTGLGQRAERHRYERNAALARKGLFGNTYNHPWFT